MSIEKPMPAKFGKNVRVRVVAGTCEGWVGRVLASQQYPTLGTHIYDVVFEGSHVGTRGFFEAELEEVA